MGSMTNEEIVQAIQAGNNGLMDQLWKQCYKFIKQKAMQRVAAWHCASIDADDLIQCGYMALCDAVKGFDAERGNFINYLSYHLQKAFRDAYGMRKTNRDPSFSAWSLDAPATKDGDGLTLGETIESDENGIEIAEDAIYHEQMSTCLHEAVSRLSDRKRKTIEGHFFDGKNYADIGKELDVSASRVGYIIHDGLKALRRGRDAEALLDYLTAGKRNMYAGTSFTTWKNTGCSIQERLIINEESRRSQYNLESAEGRVMYCIRELGIPRKTAEALLYGGRR